MIGRFHPSAEQHHPMTFEAKDSIGQRSEDLRRAINLYKKETESGQRSRRRAMMGSALGKATMKVWDCGPHLFDMQEHVNELSRIIGDEQDAKISFTGIHGEFVAAYAATNYDIDVYLPTVREDVDWGVDLWFDPRQAEIDSFCIDEAQDRWNMGCLSIKTSVDMPNGGEFPSLFSAKTVGRFVDDFDSNKDAFFDYFVANLMDGATIEQKWERLRNIGLAAAESMHGGKRGGTGITDLYDNVAPVVLFVPSINSATQVYNSGSGCPNQMTVDKIGSAFFRELDI